MMMQLLATDTTVADSGGDGSGFTIAALVIVVLAVVWIWGGRLQRNDRYRNGEEREYQAVIHEYNLHARAAGRPDYWIPDQDRYGPADSAWQVARNRVATRTEQLQAVEGRVRSARREGFAQGYIGKTYDQ